VTRWFIDDHGDALAEGSRELADFAAIAEGGESIRLYLIEAAGFVHIDQSRRVTRVRFCRHGVQKHALIGLMYFLASNNVDAVGFEHPDDPVAMPMMPRRALWLDYVQKMLDSIDRLRPVQARSLPVATSPFATRWRGGAEICASLDGAQRDRLLDVLFDGAFVLSRQDADTGRHRFISMGRKHRPLDPEFYDTVAGRDVQEGHDQAFASWAHDSYSEVQTAGEPLADDIDAQIIWPGKPRALFRYSRLRVPVVRGSGERLTLAAISAR
jgi:hypothetical protein